METNLKDWLSIIMSAIALGTVVFGWFSSGGKKAMTALDAYKAEANAAFAKGGADYATLDRRVQKLEDALPHMPDREDFHKLELAMEKLVGTVNVLAQKVDTNEAVVLRVDEYLRESGK